MAHKYAPPRKGGEKTKPDSTETPQPESTQSESTAQKPAEGPSAEKPQSKLTGLRNWNVDESVDGISGSRIRDCIIYQLDFRKADFYTKNLTRGFVLRNAKRLHEDTPEDYVYDPDPLVGEVTKHLDGGETFKQTLILRAPRDDAERRRIRDRYGVNSYTIRFLAKPGCPVCRGTGYQYVSAYPGDPVYSKLTEAVECACIHE